MSRYRRHCLAIAIICFALSLIIFTAGCATSALKWDTTEKAMLGTIITAQAIDVYQAHEVTTEDEYAGYEEANPFVTSVLGDEVGLAEGAALKAVVLGPLLYLGAHRLPSTHFQRKVILGFIIGASTFVVIRNEQVTGGIVLKRF